MYKNKKIFILGMARSGYEVAKLLAGDNKVFITDMKEQDKEKVNEKTEKPVPEKKEKKKYIPPMSHPWKLASFKQQMKKAHTERVYA